MNTRGFSGNAHIHAQLQGSLSHAYLISGPDANQRRALADLIACALICAKPNERPCDCCAACQKAMRGVHPDIMAIAPEAGKDIPVTAVRQMVRDAPTLPNEAEHKVYIVNDADALNHSAQNAFLKLLEEPPGFVTFLLLAENHLALLPTIRSRSIHLGLAPENNLSTKPSDEAQALAVDFCTAYDSGTLDLLTFCVNLEKAAKEDKQMLTGFIEATYTKLVVSLSTGTVDKPRLMTAVTLFDSLRNDLRFNVSPGHISGKILATLI